MNELLGLAIQLAIVSIGIWVFLRFARRTRGNRSVRSLLVTLTVLGLGLYLLVESLDLEELRHLIQSVAGFVVVVLAIVFQPELRRAVAQLGENQLAGGSEKRVAESVLAEIAEAARRMAARKHGALIAIECDSPLDPYTVSGQLTGAPVSRLLLESIFHPGGALHDGAVIVREGEIVASMCVLPLSESLSLDPSIGTRHRAALGLSEETDAVLVVVSEESGKISIARRGKLERDVPPAELEAALRRVLGSSAAETRRSGRALLRRAREGVGSLRQHGRSELTWVGLAIAIAAGLLFVANQNLRQNQDYVLRVVAQRPDQTQPPIGDTLVVRLPDGDSRLLDEDLRVSVNVSATRSQHDRLRSSLAGIYTVEPGTEGTIELRVDDVRWQVDLLGLGIRWTANVEPELRVRSTEERTLALAPTLVPIDKSDLSSGFHVPEDAIEFSREFVVLRGPGAVLDALAAPGAEPLFVPVTGFDESDEEHEDRLGLDDHWKSQGVELVGSPPEISFPIDPTEKSLGTIEREIALVCMDPERRELLDQYALPDNYQRANFRVVVSGLLPAGDVTTDAAVDRKSAILQFVRDNLSAYVDVAEVADQAGGRSVPVRHALRRDWREAKSELGFDGLTLTNRESIEVVLVDDALLLLTEVE